jgi:hypothetical protein
VNWNKKAKGLKHDSKKSLNISNGVIKIRISKNDKNTQSAKLKEQKGKQ